MKVYLLEDMHTKNAREMRNWSKIAQIIQYGNAPPPLYEIHRSHTATIFKITFADYHYHILDQLYRPNETPRSTDTMMWARAEMNSIVYNLYSALDSLANEINLAYNFGIGEHKIHIFHKHQKFKSGCLRCNLDKRNDRLTSTLNQELSQDWFVLFNKWRNQITHKALPVFGQAISTGDPQVPDDAIHLTIFEDPAKEFPTLQSKPEERKQFFEDIMNNVVKTVEVNQFCKDLRNNVVRTVEEVFDLLGTPIKNTFNLRDFVFRNDYPGVELSSHAIGGMPLL